MDSDKSKEKLEEYAEELDVEEVKETALDLLKTAEEYLDLTREPASIATACIYIALILEGQRMKQKEITSTTNCSPVTLRNTYMEISKGLETGKRYGYNSEEEPPHEFYRLPDEIEEKT